MARIDLIRNAERPKLNARALFQGPQGSGKTWTMLSVARALTAGTSGRILGIDTERESMLTYADVFTFQHLPWRPPYAPDELTATLDQLGARWVESPDDVVVIDSSSHFWQGSGGILDIAGGRVQGGWDKARPMQQALVEAMLALPCHLLLGARMKNSVLVSDGGRTIENVGLTIVQDETLGYELNVVVQMDMGHNVTVMKSRTPAVPVGRMYPGGSEGKLAADYAEWLAGGVPPANREDVEAIVAVFGGIADRDRRKVLKDEFVAEFGMPHSLTADQVPDARQWLADQGAAVGEGPAAADQPDARTAIAGEAAARAADDEDPANFAADQPDETPPAEPDWPDDYADAFADDPTPDPDAPDTIPEAVRRSILDEVQGLAANAVRARLAKAGLRNDGNPQTRAARLAAHLLTVAGVATDEERDLAATAVASEPPASAE